ncbi:MAG TPA: MBL fold metallo-hydrolase [Solirubrobacterales bacterium]|jgi:glyoxylase-like metal-dependent hydrolase (beta-lactamase superfamily II)
MQHSTETAPGHPEILRIIAPNPGPMTLEGTNTYVYGSEPCTVIDPGPDDDGHVEAILAAAAERGGIGVVLLTHSHADHAAAAHRLGAEVLLPRDGEEARTDLRGLRVLATPGHAVDHVSFLSAEEVCFAGDLVLGLGSTIVGPDGGGLAAYMESLRLLRAEPLKLICPGHGPWITDPDAKLDEYIGHREERERRLLAALERGERSRAALLAEAWDDVPAVLLPMAAMAMEAHLEKLEAEGRIPGDLTA